MILGTVAFTLCVFLQGLSFASDFLPSASAIFSRQDIALKGRLRMLTLEDVFPSPGREVVILEREGEYPDWKRRLSVWGLREAAPSSLERKASFLLPDDVLLYGFVPFNGHSRLVFIFRDRIEVLAPQDGTFKAVESSTLPIDTVFPSPEPGQAVPVRLGSVAESSEAYRDFFVPVRQGVQRFRLLDSGVKALEIYPVPVRSFYRSNVNDLELNVSYWVRAASWYPGVFRGALDPKGPPILFFPWMDEVTIAEKGRPGSVGKHFFHQLTEDERDDAQSYVVTIPKDLDGDGRTDFIVNRFKGLATSMQAKTSVFFTRPDGTIPPVGLEVKAEGNRAAGAFPVDFNRDGRMDLAVVSSHFNAWSVIRALVRRTVLVNFSFHLYHDNGYNLEKPDFSREVAFRFSLTDLAIEGLLPSLEGDFNGDGYPDAVYARNRQEITVLLQDPDRPQRFPETPSGRYFVTVPRLFRVGDLTGDARSDLVLYDDRSDGNRKVTVLFNTGVL